MRHIDELNGTNIVEVGVDLSEFYTSVEWDILEVPAVRYVKLYSSEVEALSSHVQLIKNNLLANILPQSSSSCITLCHEELFKHRRFTKLTSALLCLKLCSCLQI